MTRSVKDLREIICVSRLNGFENVHHLNESLNSGCNKKSVELPCNKKKLKKIAPFKSQCNIGEYEKWYRVIDEDSLKELLSRANKDLDWLCKWAEEINVRVHFMQWWLAGVSSSDRKELINLEYEIACAEILVTIKRGCNETKVAENATKYLLRLVLWEYPDDILSQSGPHLFLDYLNQLISHDCKHLLSAVSINTHDSQTIHYCLSVRAFTLVSLWCSLVRFHNRLLQTGSLIISPLLSHPPPGDPFISLLSITISHEFIAVLQYWIQQNKIDLTTFRDTDGRNLLTLAVSFKSHSVVKYILDNFDVSGIIDSVSHAGNSALHLAVCQGSVELVKLLVDDGHADVDVVNNDCDGCTPLHMAAIYGQRDIARLLIDRGADSGAKTTRDGSAEDMAVIFQETEMGHLLSQMQQLEVENDSSEDETVH